MSHGHILDMISRLKYNSAEKKIRQQKREDFRQKFIDDTRIAGNYGVRHSDISDKDLMNLKLKIKADIGRDRKRNIIRAVIVTTILISICLFILINRI
jgi:hypothetical protein